MEDYCAHYTDYLQLLSAIDDTSSDALMNSLWDCVGHYGHPQPGSRLVQCGMAILPDKSENPSVIYNGYLNKGEPISIAENAALWLKCDGIVKVSPILSYCIDRLCNRLLTTCSFPSNFFPCIPVGGGGPSTKWRCPFLDGPTRFADNEC